MIFTHTWKSSLLKPNCCFVVQLSVEIEKNLKLFRLCIVIGSLPHTMVDRHHRVY